MKEQYTTTDEYIRTFPAGIQALLNKTRQTIRQAAPEATKAIGYGIPTFKLNGNLVHFAAFKNHIGFYPTPSGIEAFEKEISQYKWAKGSIQFPLDKPVPLDLVKRIVVFRVQAVSQRKASKRSG